MEICARSSAYSLMNCRMSNFERGARWSPDPKVDHWHYESIISYNSQHSAPLKINNC
ncbi:hypothetical protein LguiB_003097 [Lonicera macranthoides]